MPNIVSPRQDRTEEPVLAPPPPPSLLMRLDALGRAFAARGPMRFRAMRLAIILIVDAIIMFASFELSRAILASMRMPQTLQDHRFTIAFVGINLAVLFAIGTYRHSWRFVSVADALSLTGSLLVSSWLIWMVTAGMIIPQKMYRGVMTVFLAVDIPLTVTLLVAARVARREFFKYLRATRLRRSMKAHRRILLLGELDWARVMADLVPTDLRYGLEIVGVISFDSHDRRLQVGGLPILGTPDMLAQIVTDLDRAGKRPVSLVVQESSERLDRQQILRIAALAEQEHLVVSRFRSPWTAPQPSPDELPIERMPLVELLGRPEITVQHSYLERVVTGARVMVTGAGGTIGGELVRQLAHYHPAEIILLDHAEYNLYAIELEAKEKFPDVRFHAELCSIRQRPALWQVFARRRPEIVFHAAALKHVPMVEANPCAGVHTNVLGTRNVADAVCEFEARAMIQVSTDKAVNPIGLMGATKRLGELYCQALDLIGACDPESPRFLTVRFGNVLGSSGSLIPLFQHQLATGKPLTVTHPDIERFFMTVQEAVLLILQSSARALETDSERGTIFVLDMGKPVKIVEIARRVIHMAGLRPDIDVPIKFIGLRPGEKLFEELFDTTEGKVESAIPGIFEAMPSPIPLELLVEGFAQLARLIAAGDARELVRLTHEMVAASACSCWAEILRRLSAESQDARGAMPHAQDKPAAPPLPRDVA